MRITRGGGRQGHTKTLAHLTTPRTLGIQDYVHAGASRSAFAILSKLVWHKHTHDLAAMLLRENELPFIPNTPGNISQSASHCFQVMLRRREKPRRVRAENRSLHPEVRLGLQREDHDNLQNIDDATPRGRIAAVASRALVYIRSRGHREGVVVVGGCCRENWSLREEREAMHKE